MSAQPPILVVSVAEDASARSCLDSLAESGFCLRRTCSPSDALDLACDASLILLDGWFDGAPAFCEQLRGDPATAGVLLLLLDDRDPASTPGPDAFLPRSAGPARVAAQVNLLLRLRQVEDASRTSQSRLQNILDHTPVAVSVKDAQGRYLLVNRCWEAHFHHRRDFVVGRTVHEVFAPEEADRLAERARAVLASGAPLEFEETALQCDGPHTYLKTKFALQENGAASGVCGIAIDITERKRAEQALRDSQVLYHSLVETLPVRIFRKDLEGRFTFVNGPFRDELHRPESEILGRRDRDFFPEELAAKYTRDDRQVISSGGIFECIEEHFKPEGEKRFVQVVKSQLRNAAGAVIGMQGVFWDVTDRKRTEEELARAVADVEVARRVQKKLFPAAASPLVREAALRGFDVAGESYPVDPVGGDYYDYFSLDGNRLAVAVGDVSGHGSGPAILMAVARAYLRASARPDASPADVLARVNQLLSNDMEGDRYITLLLARLDMEARSLVYASAGHATGYILDAEGAVKHSLTSTGVPLGVSLAESFPNSDEIPLAGGDVVVLLTDGVVEAHDPQRHQFDPERVLDLVRVYRRASAAQIVHNLYHAVRAFGQNHPQLDDVTATVIKVAGG